MKSVRPGPVSTSLFEYYRSYLVDFVSNRTFNLRNHMFSCYANLTLPEFGHFRYAWDYQTTALFSVFLNDFQVLCLIKPWCRRKCLGINVALLRYCSARCANATSSPTAATAASTTSTANIAAPAAAAPPLYSTSGNSPCSHSTSDNSLCSHSTPKNSPCSYSTFITDAAGTRILKTADDRKC